MESLFDGSTDGIFVGLELGIIAGIFDGSMVGIKDGLLVGVIDGWFDGLFVGINEGSGAFLIVFGVLIANFRLCLVNFLPLYWSTLTTW